MLQRPALFVALATLLALPAPVAAQAERARCSIDNAPARPCTVAFTVRSGLHRMTFTIGGRRVVFVGRSQTGWWSGKLDGRPAMGYERNRGNMVISTTDLKTVFAWWYPGNEHGSY